MAWCERSSCVCITIIWRGKASSKQASTSVRIAQLLLLCWCALELNRTGGKATVLSNDHLFPYRVEQAKAVLLKPSVSAHRGLVYAVATTSIDDILRSRVSLGTSCTYGAFQSKLTA
eukprot:1159282-Pelagomonas_calceolata.AAC.17